MKVEYKAPKNILGTQNKIKTRKNEKRKIWIDL